MMDSGKCSHGCVWPQGHDIWPLGGLVSDNQPLGPRKWPKIGQKWVYQGSKKFSTGSKVLCHSLGWKCGIHAKNQNFWFINGRDPISWPPLYYLMKKSFEHLSGRFSRPPPPLKKFVARTSEHVRRKKTLGPFGPQSLFSINHRSGQRPPIWIPTPMNPNDGFREMFQRMCLTPMAWYMTIGRFGEW